MTNTNTLYFHATNTTLERALNLLDPFVRASDIGLEQSGFEDEIEYARR